MKISEIRDLTVGEMQNKVSELKEELFNLRFQHGIGQLENPQRMKETKRDIAKLKTVIREVILTQEKGSE